MSMHTYDSAQLSDTMKASVSAWTKSAFFNFNILATATGRMGPNGIDEIK
jgi:hypothetical protein